MNIARLNVHNLQKTLSLMTAYVYCKLLRRDLRTEAARLEKQKKHRTNAEIAFTVLIIFAAALLASSFGWKGLMLYFLLAAVLFR
tara:strand:- start:778 stop:1032 length:255 start_codon:yes stop_codon:yes gene_type:complete